MSSPFDDLVKEALALIDYEIVKETRGPARHEYVTNVYIVKDETDILEVASYMATQIKDTDRFKHLANIKTVNVFARPRARAHPELGTEVTIEWGGFIPAVDVCLLFKIKGASQ